MDSYAPLTLHAPLPKPPAAVLSPTLHRQQAPSPPIDQASQAVANSMRRKKNADAQAAFRARRATYIASLEETVTSLEAVILSLQDTCGEVRNDASALRRENARLTSAIEGLKQAGRERERQWREFCQTKQQALGLDDAHFSDMPSITSLFQPSTVPSRQYGDDHFRYQNTGSSDSHTQTDPYALPSAAADQRYPYATTPPDDSPSLSPNVHYLSRFPIPDDNRVSVVNVTMPGHAYDASAAVIQGNYSPDDYQNARPLSDVERYAPRPRRSYSDSQSRANGFYSAAAEGEGLNGEGGFPDASGHASRPRRHTSASLGHAPPLSHSSASSPSPSDKERDREPPMSNTLAMIKAQAFGSLRRTRPKPKKTAETASKAAVDVLNARGIGMGVQQPSEVRPTLKRKADDMNVLA